MDPPEIYDGAHFTLRYDQCKQRITQFYLDSHTNWRPFGIDAVWQYCEDNNLVEYRLFPNFIAERADICRRFELRNMFKELSAETPDAWGRLAAQKLTETASRYEAILAMENSTDFDVSDPNKDSRSIEYGHVINGQVQDTPYGQLQSGSDYVSGRTREEHSGQDTIHERNDLDADILMDLRRRWDSTINQIIEEFDELFIRIIGGDFIA